MNTPQALDPETEAANRERSIAEALKFRMEADKYAAEAASQAAFCRSLEADARKAEINLEEFAVMHARNMAEDRFNHVYRFNEMVCDASVEHCMNELTIWHRLDPECRIELVLNSPGGSAFAGMELFDYLQELRRDGHYLITATRGMAASMAGILLQAGDERVAGRESYALIHEVSSLALGKSSEIEDEVSFMKKMQERVLSIFVEGSARARANGTSELALTRSQIENGDQAKGIKGWLRRDWWLDSDEMLRFGIVDKVR